MQQPRNNSREIYYLSREPARGDTPLITYKYKNCNSRGIIVGKFIISAANLSAWNT